VEQSGPTRSFRQGIHDGFATGSITNIIIHGKQDDASMKTKSLRLIFAGLMAILLTGSMFGRLPAAEAQSRQYWSDPINLSKSGSSVDPELVIDSDGEMHVIWADAADERYKYVKSNDGKSWTDPEYADFPFSEAVDGRPSFYAAPNRIIYIAWRDKGNTLFVGQAQSRYLETSNSWRMNSVIAYSTVIAYDAVLDSQGVLHVAYVSKGGASTPAGVFYSQVSGGGSTKAVNLYLSSYLRSAEPESAHVRIAVTERDSVQQIYAAWDDRAQKRVFLARSDDGGKKWGEAAEMVGPEAVTGISMPFNVDIGAVRDNVLLLWQIGQPGAQCTPYSAWSTDGGTEFGLPEKVLEPVALCGQPSEFVQINQDYFVTLFNFMGDLSLMAWNGRHWSEAQSQNEIAAFTNPDTLDSVIFGCQKKLTHGSILYLVGCDQGNGGDIWLTSRPLGAIDDWFPSSAMWSAPIEAAAADQEISALSAVADSHNIIHAFWIQAPAQEGDGDAATIQQMQWDGSKWSRPMPVLSQRVGGPMQLDVQIDSEDRLLLAWIDSQSGDMFFNWAGAERSKSPAEWQKAQYIPSPSQTNSSPEILVDQAGRIIIAYAVPINDKRGIYFVESGDGGETWTQPIRAFDAVAAGWEVVDEPQLGLTGDGRLHLLLRQYSLHGEQRIPLGLYYSQSVDGGMSWSPPEIVSQNPTAWSGIIAYDKSTLHRIWQEQQQSMLVTLHQVSADGGATWSLASIVSSIDPLPGLTADAIDGAGGLHLLQVESKENPIILDQMWNGFAWIPQVSKEVYLQERAVPVSVAAAITAKGNLLAAIALDFPFFPDPQKNNSISVERALELPDNVPAPYLGIIPAIEPTANPAEGISDALLPATQEATKQDLQDLPSFLSGKKNLVGGILVGGIIIVLAAVFLPRSRKHKKQNKAS
jgi:hypothetical protein